MSRSHLPHSAHPLPKPAMPLDELEALGLVMGQARLEEHRVHPELCVQQRHIAVHLDKEVDTFVPLVKVGIIVRQGLGTSWASESPPRGHLEQGRRSSVRIAGANTEKPHSLTNLMRPRPQGRHGFRQPHALRVSQG